MRNKTDRRPASGQGPADLRLAVCVALALLIVVRYTGFINGAPVIYFDQVTDIISGRVPYIDLPFEHLPGTLIPLGLAWLLGGFAGESAYWWVFAALMAGCLWGTQRLLGRIGEGVEISSSRDRWLVQVGPLLPIVLFTNDPWVVLLTVGAVDAMVRNANQKSGVLSLAATLSKGWPLVLEAVGWLRGNRAQAVALTATSGVILGLVGWSPGFRGSQLAQGLHAETLVGSIAGLSAVGFGDGVLLQPGLRATFDVPIWMVLLNAVPGLIVLVGALRATPRPFAWLPTLRFTAALIVGLMLCLPVLSAQFLLWFVPFVVFCRVSERRLSALTCWLDLGVVLTWQQVFANSLWWWSALVLRNLMLVGLGVRLSFGDRGLDSDRTAIAPLLTTDPRPL
jgi:hypothetical protein